MITNGNAHNVLYIIHCERYLPIDCEMHTGFFEVNLLHLVTMVILSDTRVAAIDAGVLIVYTYLCEENITHLTIGG